MSQDELPSSDMKYSFKAHVQSHGFVGDLIISSTTVNDLVKSIKLLERAGITPTVSAQQAATTPTCPVHQRPMKPSRKPGSFYCSTKVNDDYCSQKNRK